MTHCDKQRVCRGGGHTEVNRRPGRCGRFGRRMTSLLAPLLLAGTTGLAFAQEPQIAPSGAGFAPATVGPTAIPGTAQPAPGPAPLPVQPPAQDAAPAPGPAQAAAPGITVPAQPPATQPGFLSEFSRWWKDGIADFNAKMKDQQNKLDALNKQSSEAAVQAMKNAAKATEDATNAMFHFSASKIIEIHERCPPAGNGAPDCQTAALNACRGKGFKEGQPVDIRTAEACTASLWVSGQAPPTPGNCPIESTVLRAACQ